MPKEVFKWEDPPAVEKGGKRHKRKGIWERRLSKLKTRPGQWAIVWSATPQSCQGSVQQIKHGRMYNVDAKEFEFTVRTAPSNGKKPVGVLYARYLPQPDPELERLLAEEEHIENHGDGKRSVDCKFCVAEVQEEAELEQRQADELEAVFQEAYGK